MQFIHPLEARLMLAAVYAKDYMEPQDKTALFRSNINGWSTKVTVTPNVRRVTINNRTAREMRTQYTDGTYDALYVSTASSGDHRLHGLKIVDDETLTCTFGSPIVDFRYKLALGTTYKSSTSVSATLDGVRGSGSATGTVKAAKMETVSVPAGTFSTVRVDRVLNMNMTARVDGDSVQLLVQVKQYLWYAKGKGVVKSSETYTQTVKADCGYEDTSRTTEKRALIKFVAKTTAGPSAFSSLSAARGVWRGWALGSGPY